MKNQTLREMSSFQKQGNCTKRGGTDGHFFEANLGVGEKCSHWQKDRFGHSFMQIRPRLGTDGHRLKKPDKKTLMKFVPAYNLLRRGHLYYPERPVMVSRKGNTSI